MQANIMGSGFVCQHGFPGKVLDHINFKFMDKRFDMM